MLTNNTAYDIIKTVKEVNKQEDKEMKLYEINEGFEGTQEEAISLGEYHDVEAPE